MAEDQTTEIVTSESWPMLQVGTRSMGGLIPRNLDELWRMSVMFAKSGMMPKGIQQPEAIAVAIQMGLEIGLSPMQAVQNIAVINGRPSIWGDAALGLVQASGKLVEFNESFKGEPYTDGWTAICMAMRAGKEKEIIREFSYGEAKRAGLVDKPGPWKQYTRRMLQMRARSWCLRDGFADVLKGLQVREEVIDMESIGGGRYAPKEDLQGKIQEAAQKPNPSEKKIVDPGANGEASAANDDEADVAEGGKYNLWPRFKGLRSGYASAIWKAIKDGSIQQATPADLVEMKEKWERLPSTKGTPWPLDKQNIGQQEPEDPAEPPPVTTAQAPIGSTNLEPDPEPQTVPGPPDSSDIDAWLANDKNVIGLVSCPRMDGNRLPRAKCRECEVRSKCEPLVELAFAGGKF